MPSSPAKISDIICWNVLEAEARPQGTRQWRKSPSCVMKAVRSLLSTCKSTSWYMHSEDQEQRKFSLLGVLRRPPQYVKVDGCLLRLTYWVHEDPRTLVYPSWFLMRNDDSWKPFRRVDSLNDACFSKCFGFLSSYETASQTAKCKASHSMSKCSRLRAVRVSFL